MRLPSDVLDRVRGAVVVAALASACGGQEAPPSAPAPAPSVAPVAEALPPPEPLDPVAYSAADEDARLARLDSELAVADARRTSRIDQLRAARTPRFGGIGTPLDPDDPGIGIGLSPHVCYACGRG